MPDVQVGTGVASGLTGGRGLQLEALKLLGDVADPAAVDELVRPQRQAAVWALRALLHQPAPDAREAAQLGTVGAEASVPQLVHAYEAPKHVCDALYYIWI